jgi:hypothetical protein
MTFAAKPPMDINATPAANLLPASRISF